MLTVNQILEFFDDFFDKNTKEPDPENVYAYLDKKVHWSEKLMADDDMEADVAFKIVVQCWAQMALAVYEGLKSGVCDALATELFTA